MPQVPILDSHVHLYDPAAIAYGWMASAPLLAQRYDTADLDRHAAPWLIDRIVAVEVDADRGRHLDEAAWIQNLADRDPRIVGFVAHAPLENGAAVEPDLDALQQRRCVRAIRRLLQGELDPAFCLRPGFVEGVRRAGARGLAIDLCIRHPAGQMPAVTELVTACPDVTFVLDHLGKPGIAGGDIAGWKRDLAALAARPNIFCKVSGVITEADRQRWTVDDIRPAIDHAIASFGLDRVMYGSDWTVGLLTHPYPRWVEILDQALAGCSIEEQKAFWNGNAAKAYRL